MCRTFFFRSNVGSLSTVPLLLRQLYFDKVLSAKYPDIAYTVLSSFLTFIHNRACPLPSVQQLCYAWLKSTILYSGEIQKGFFLFWDIFSPNSSSSITSDERATFSNVCAHLRSQSKSL